jgi:hypothetical protein
MAAVPRHTAAKSLVCVVWLQRASEHTRRVPKARQARDTRGNRPLRIVIRARSRFQPRAENVTISTSPAR